MADRWRDDDRDYGYDDVIASSMSNHSRGRPRGNENWRHDAFEESDWKRRRTNDDNYEPVHNRYYSGAGGDEEYQGRERETYAPRRARVRPSDPSPHVIFLGLHPDFTEENLHTYLTSGGFSVASVTIIRDRQTGMSKSFGFAQFGSLEDAQSFLEPNFPFLTLPAPSYVPPGGLPPSEGGEDLRARRVKIDYSQSANPHTDPSRPPRNGPRSGSGADANDGTKDIGSAHVPVILLRGLDVGSTPETIGEALRESEGPGRKSAKGMRRVILIRDRASKISLGIAFVEFVDVQGASIVLANTMSPTLFPNGFRISGIPVAASFAHPHSFRMVADGQPRDESCIDATEALGARNSGFAKYWDDNTVVSELIFEIEGEKPTVPKRSKEKKKERTKDKNSSEKEGGLPPGITDVPAPTALKTSAAPVSMTFKSTKPGSNLELKAAAGISDNILVAPVTFDDGEGGNNSNDATGSEDKTSTYRRVAPMIASKKVANNIMKWNNVQDELKSEETPASQVPAESSPPTATAPTTVGSMKAATPPFVSADTLEYGDTNKLACLLCSRQFKALDQLRRHTAESDLHKSNVSSACYLQPSNGIPFQQKNLGDASLCEVAHARVAAARQAATQASDTVPKYRDRAFERRVIYGQPDVPLPPTSGESNLTSSKRKYADGPSPPPKAPTPPPPHVNPGEDANNKGNMLLKKMGWSAGTGLGLSGDGRVDPIATAIYQQGVGLGAAKAKDLTKVTNPFDYASNVKDSARERFENS